MRHGAGIRIAWNRGQCQATLCEVAGGIIGTLTVVGDTEVTLVTTPGVELQVLRGAVSRRLDPPAAPDEVIEVDDPDDRGG